MKANTYIIDQAVQTKCKFDDNYLVNYCPFCGKDISYKTNGKDDPAGHEHLFETGYYERTCYGKCLTTGKYYKEF